MNEKKNAFKDIYKQLKQVAAFVRWGAFAVALIVLAYFVVIASRVGSMEILIWGLLKSAGVLIGGLIIAMLLYAFADQGENIDLLRANMYTITTIMEKQHPDLAEDDDDDDEEEEEE